jgi:hypothetical protein
MTTVVAAVMMKQTAKMKRSRKLETKEMASLKRRRKRATALQGMATRRARLMISKEMTQQLRFSSKLTITSTRLRNS